MIDKKRVEVTVRSRPNHGKTTIARLIYDALSASGFESTLDDPDGIEDEDRARVFQDMRLEFLAGKVEVEVRASFSPRHDRPITMLSHTAVIERFPDAVAEFMDRPVHTWWMSHIFYLMESHLYRETEHPSPSVHRWSFTLKSWSEQPW